MDKLSGARPLVLLFAPLFHIPKDPPQGIVPPPNEEVKKTCGNDSVHRLRKFIAKPSAGLRIRIHPTLQSEQIGVIPVDGTVSIIDELSNSDGVWVRLGPDVMAEAAPNHVEGWCLQFNQHLEKTLMNSMMSLLPIVLLSDCIPAVRWRFAI